MSEARDALGLWLRRLERRSVLSDADRATILSFPGEIRNYASSRDIARLGETMDHSCLVAAGMVARFGQTMDGHRQFTAVYIPGDMADLHSAVVPMVSAPLQSMLAATIYRIPHESIHAAAEQSPTLARAFWRDCVIDAQIAAEWMLSIGRHPAMTKVAHLICELACRYESVGLAHHEFRLPLTQGQIGDALGLTGVHVNRMLRALHRQGLLQTENQVLKILDWPALAAIGEFRPAYLHLKRETDW